MRKALAAVAGLGVAALVLAGCSGSPGDGGSKGGSDDASQVEVFTWWASGSEKTGLDALVKVFGEQFPKTKFVNAAGGDLHLQDISPAIDAAATGTIMDIDNKPRGIDVPQAPTSPNLGPYDLGAYEVQHIDPEVPITFPPDENFDELYFINSLPANWQVMPSSGPAAWSLFATAADSGLLSAYVPDLPTANDSSLTTLAFHVEHDGRLSFRHKVSLDPGPSGTTADDAAVLEIQVGSDPSFHDIISAGGRFITGGYDHVVTAGASLLAGRSAWSGTSDSFRTVLVMLPAAANGQDVKLRWRVATNASFGRDGYWLDTIHVDVVGPANDFIFADGFDGAFH